MESLKYSRHDVLKICLLFFILLSTNNRIKSDASVIRLFNEYHFYELAVDRHDELKGLNLIQSFGYQIVGEEKCATRVNEPFITRSFQSTDDFGSEIDLKAETLIYSNYEQTLSFLIQITFKSIGKINNNNVQGFELVFESPFDNNKITCVQIIPNSEDFFKSIPNKYKFTIKDPSFLSQNEKYYLFYFGKLSIRPLVQCNTKQTSIIRNGKKLCALDSLNTQPIQIGIKSEFEISSQPLIADTCPGHVLIETCIMRYPKPPSSSLVFVLHPIPDDFIKLVGDLDITVQESERETKLIETYSYEKFPSGIAIKLIDYSSDEINYVSKFNKANLVNSCNRTQFDQLGCNCNGVCYDCYSVKNRKNIEYIPLSFEKSSQSVVKSKACTTKKFYTPYNFESIKIETSFQNQLLSNQRKKPFELLNNINDVSQIYNREQLPRICINVKNGKSDYLFDISLVLNDYHQVGESSITNETKYKIRVHSFDYTDQLKFLNIYADDLLRVKTKLVLDEHRLIRSTDIIEIKNLVQSKYLLELIPIPNNKFCPRMNKCIDESIRNNQIQCSKCNKLVALFTLENRNEFDKNHFFKFDIATNRIETLIRNPSEEDYTADFKCSRDDAYLQSLLMKSLNYNTKQHRLNGISKIDLYSGMVVAVVPEDIKLDILYLPYIKLASVHNHASFESLEIIKIESFIILTPVFVILLLVIVCVLYVYFKGKNDLLKVNYRKQVLFYLSIDVDYQAQQELRSLIEKYQNILKKHFKRMDISIVDYKTNYKTRRILLDQSDLILYVCCTEKEIVKLREPMKIGQNDFHDDYNRIHFYTKYQRKSLNITFNKNVNEIDFSGLAFNKKREPNETKLALSSEDSVISSLFGNIQTNGNYLYLKLPNQNEELLAYLIENETDVEQNLLNSESDSANSIKILRSRLNDLPYKILIYNMNRKMTRLIETELKMSKKLANLTHNIDFNDQPNEEESLFEESDDDFSSLENSSQFSSIQSNNVYDERLSLLNESINRPKKKPFC